MAVLESLRGKVAGGIISGLIFVSLLLFVVDINSLTSALNTTSSKYAVGKINGSKVPYKDFQEQVEYQTKIAEIMSGSSISTDQQQQQVRQMAWQHFVDQDLFLKAAKAAGIEVGQKELVALTSGDMVSPVIAYDPVFGDPNGNFDVQKLRDMLSNMDNDASGNLRMYWNYIQNQILTQQYYAKYGSLFASSNMPNSLTVQNAINENNTSASIEAVMVPMPMQRDSTINVTSSEINKYYKDHKSFFKAPDNRDIMYALFEVVPSEDDIDAARKSLEDIYEEFQTVENVRNFMMRNSEQPLRNYYYKEGELRSENVEINDFVFSNAAGVSPIIKSGDSFYAARIVDTKAMPDSVYVRHILIQNDNNLADSLLNVVKSGATPFSQLAALYSVDQNTNVPERGDLGWMTQTYMIPGMEAVMQAEIGKPFILDTQYGRHIVEVTKKTKDIQKKQVAILQKTAIPSKATMNEAYNKANILATSAAGRLDSLVSAAKAQNVYLHTMNITEATSRYSSVDRAKEVTRKAFELKEDEVSNVITVNSNYLFVVGVKKVNNHKNGYASVEEVASRIETILYEQKVADKAVADVAEKIKGCNTMEEVAKALDQTVFTRDNVTFSSLVAQDNEPALLGAVAGAEQGKITGPVKGAMGVYVVCVKDRSTASFYTEDDARQMEMQKNQYATQMIVPAMLDATNSVDNRERFY